MTKLRCFTIMQNFPERVLDVSIKERYVVGNIEEGTLNFDFSYYTLQKCLRISCTAV